MAAHPGVEEDFIGDPKVLLGPGETWTPTPILWGERIGAGLVKKHSTEENARVQQPVIRHPKNAATRSSRSEEHSRPRRRGNQNPPPFCVIVA